MLFSYKVDNFLIFETFVVVHYWQLCVVLLVNLFPN